MNKVKNYCNFVKEGLRLRQVFHELPVFYILA